MITVAALAELPTAPALSGAFREAATYADHGPFLAIRRAMFGTITFEDFITVVTPDHAIGEGVALIIIGGLVDPDVTDQGWPDETWDAGYFSQRVGRAHAAISGWYATHTTRQLAHLLEAAADRAHAMETTPAQP